ncbi:MAG: histidine ammonia-lyase [Chitinophagia bacterium]|nr:histidine ammonia-lyase [Chitinophagia bacterium]
MQLPEFLTLAHLQQLPEQITLSSEAKGRINHNRAYLDSKIQEGGTYYGINTGFGSLCNVRVQDNELSQLQENLVTSHACGMGNTVPNDVVRLMLLLKVHGLSLGYSGVREVVVQRLADMYNRNILPVVFELGSLGASGDLAPLAHLCLPLLGKGEVWYKGERMPALQALQAEGLEPMGLAAKEGLALLNGTQFMTSYLAYSLLQGQRLAAQANAIAALSADAWLAKQEPYKAPLHRIRPHAGQVATAASMLAWLEGSEIQQQPKAQVQDPYSFRCIPQVHGASNDALGVAVRVLETEINSVTDNPIVFHDEDAIVSGGNFHGQPLALQADFAAIALAELANISERRTYLMVSGQRGLPPFLAPDAGLNSGFMIAQYTAAAIVSQNKQYCTPASVDSIVSSNGQEDHVSMGANAAVKLLHVVRNVRRVLAIELLTAAQALEFRRPLKTSPKLEQLVTELRQSTSFMATDTVLHDGLVAAEQYLHNWH